MKSSILPTWPRFSKLAFSFGWPTIIISPPPTPFVKVLSKNSDKSDIPRGVKMVEKT